MNYSDIFLLALALSIDACVVSFSYGICIKTKRTISSLALALSTGFFQAFMPVIGYFFADKIKSYILPYSKWIVFMIFMYLGITFIMEALKKDTVKNLCVTPAALFFIGIATSIDAFSAGISLLLTNTALKLSAITIGVVTFINSLLGFWSGNSIKCFKSEVLEISGGVILIFLAIKSLF